MVNLNFTIFVELGLFLVFLGAMHWLIIRPTLAHLDGRSHKIDDDRHAAEKNNDEAERLEKQYLTESAAAKREIHDAINLARRAEQKRHLEKLNERHREGDQQVRAARAEALKMVEKEREQCEAKVPEVVEAIGTRCLGERWK